MIQIFKPNKVRFLFWITFVFISLLIFSYGHSRGPYWVGSGGAPLPFWKYWRYYIPNEFESYNHEVNSIILVFDIIFWYLVACVTEKMKTTRIGFRKSLQPTSLKLILWIVLVIVSILVISFMSFKPTTKITWGWVGGAPLSFIEFSTISTYFTNGTYKVFIDQVNIYALAFDALFWYLIATVLNFYMGLAQDYQQQGKISHCNATSTT
jgi:hypothetical protein